MQHDAPHEATEQLAWFKSMFGDAGEILQALSLDHQEEGPDAPSWFQCLIEQHRDNPEWQAKLLRDQRSALRSSIIESVLKRRYNNNATPEEKVVIGCVVSGILNRQHFRLPITEESVRNELKRILRRKSRDTDHVGCFLADLGDHFWSTLRSASHALAGDARDLSEVLDLFITHVDREVLEQRKKLGPVIALMNTVLVRKQMEQSQQGVAHAGPHPGRQRWVDY